MVRHHSRPAPAVASLALGSMPSVEPAAPGPGGKRRLPKERSARSRRIFNDTLLASLGVVAAIGLFALGGLALDWLVYQDRYGLGFFDYLRVVVF